MGAENATVSHQDHVRVAEAILAGEADTAERAMRTHLRRSFEWVSHLPDRAFKRNDDLWLFEELRNPAVGANGLPNVEPTRKPKRGRKSAASGKRWRISLSSRTR